MEVRYNKVFIVLPLSSAQALKDPKEYWVSVAKLKESMATMSPNLPPLLH